MTEHLNEYQELPTLSSEAREHLEKDLGELPANIRKELEEYLSKLEPFVKAANERIDQRLANVFKK